MIKTQLKYILMANIAFLMLLSCVEEIDIDFKIEDHDILAVDGMITNDTTAHRVYISKTRPYFSDKSPIKLSGAIVTISDDYGNIFELSEKGPGIYETEKDVYGVIGRTYYLDIKYDNDYYYAESTMKRKMLTDSLGYKWNSSREQYDILLYAKEPEGIGDNYMWHVYANGKRLTDTFDKIMFIDDEYFDGTYIDGMNVISRRIDYKINELDTIIVDTHSITEESYIFYTGVGAETGFSGGPFDTPPANIQGNISNDAVGLFHASSIAREKVIIYPL